MILWMIQPLPLCLSEATPKKIKKSHMMLFWCELLQFQPVVALDIVHLKRKFNLHLAIFKLYGIRVPHAPLFRIW